MGLDLSHHPWIIGPQTMWDKIWINTFLFNIFFLINELWIGILKAKDVTIYRHVIETWNAPIGFHIIYLIRGRTCQQNTRIRKIFYFYQLWCLDCWSLVNNSPSQQRLFFVGRTCKKKICWINRANPSDDHVVTWKVFFDKASSRIKLCGSFYKLCICVCFCRKKSLIFP